MKNHGEKLAEVLEKIGLTNHEAKVYFATLSLGAASVLALSRGSGIKRTTVYSVIESLKMKGLMAEELRGLKTVFIPCNPEKLKDVFDERKRLLEKHFEDLSTLYNLKATEGTLRYYEGLEAVKQVYKGILDDILPHDDYCVIGDIGMWQRLDPKFLDAYVDRRAKMNINMRLISTDSERARQQKQFARNYNQQVKILPAGTVLTTSTIITPQKVVINQYNPPISAIVIQTESAIQSQKEMFEIMWRAVA